MPTLTYLGHACFFFETDRAACLIDPWLNPEGAFLGAWRQFPPNDHCLKWLMDKMKEKPVLVYVTHEHEDHYDEATLKKLLPLAEAFCIPDYESRYFKDRVASRMPARPRLLPENVLQSFHDIDFKIFIDESGINRDSAIFLKAEGLSFFDGNDCKIFDRALWLREQCGSIDIMSSQFSGANMHPICYEMEAADYKKISRQKKMRKFVAVRNFINDLAPKYFMPSAGPAVFPYPEHYHLNFEPDNIFPKWWEFEAYLKEKGSPVQFMPLTVGGTASTAQGEIHFTGHAEKITDEGVNEIIRYYRDIDAAAQILPQPSSDEVLKYFEREMHAKVAVLRQSPATPLSCPVYFSISDGAAEPVVYRINHADSVLERGALPTAAPYYLHNTSIASLAKLMQSGRGWGTYFLSFLFKNKRAPDIFDSVLSTFFVANDTEELDFGLKKLAGFRNNEERIDLVSEDGLSSVTCKRYCPHQGADLKYAKFDGKYIICPRHQWRFDCEHGGKADNSDDSIAAEINKKAIGF